MIKSPAAFKHLGGDPKSQNYRQNFRKSMRSREAASSLISTERAGSHNSANTSHHVRQSHPSLQRSTVVSSFISSEDTYGRASNHDQSYITSNSDIRESTPNYNVNNETAPSSRTLLPDNQRFKYYDAIKTGFDHIDEELHETASG